MVNVAYGVAHDVLHWVTRRPQHDHWGVVHMATVKPGRCRCGCGGKTQGARQWLPGHDHRAVTRRIQADFGNVSDFIDWYDAEKHPRRRPAAAHKVAA